MPPAPLPTSLPPGHRLRAGTAARLSGLPVTTLRVWERRYGIGAATKSESGQRLYSPHDVSRLRLLRQLTQRGHAIGTIATLAFDALQALAAGDTGGPAAVGGPLHDGIVVGRSAAQALAAAPECTVRAVHDDLAHAEAAPLPGVPIGWLLVRLASLHPDDPARVLALGARLGAAAILVVYAFGTEGSARGLRDAGVAVRREPVGRDDLVQWVRTVGAAARPSASMGEPPGIEPRRFSDEALARLAEMPSRVACECLRHLAEIVAQLAGFERYSQECTSTGPADAALHRRLHRTAGAARTMFEQALQGVVEQEGLDASAPGRA